MKMRYKGPLHGYNIPKNDSADPENVTPETFYTFVRNGPAIDVPKAVAKDMITLTDHRFFGVDQAEHDALVAEINAEPKKGRRRSQTIEDPNAPVLPQPVVPEVVLPSNTPAVVAKP